MARTGYGRPVADATARDAGSGGHDGNARADPLRSGPRDRRQRNSPVRSASRWRRSVPGRSVRSRASRGLRRQSRPRASPGGGPLSRCDERPGRRRAARRLRDGRDRRDARSRDRTPGLALRSGFVQDPDGSLLVAAGEPNADSALNLEAEPEGAMTIGERSSRLRAEPMDGAERRCGSDLIDPPIRHAVGGTRAADRCPAPPGNGGGELGFDARLARRIDAKFDAEGGPDPAAAIGVSSAQPHSYVIRRARVHTFGRWRTTRHRSIVQLRQPPWHEGWIDGPLGTLIISLGTLIVIDLAALAWPIGPPATPREDRPPALTLPELHTDVDRTPSSFRSDGHSKRRRHSPSAPLPCASAVGLATPRQRFAESIRHQSYKETAGSRCICNIRRPTF